MFFLLICWQLSFWNLMLKREQKDLTNLSDGTVLTL